MQTVHPRGGTGHQVKALAHSHSHDHVVQFYEREDFLIARIAAFLEEGLAAGEAAFALVTPVHREALGAELRRRGRDLDAALAEGRLILFDAVVTLRSFRGPDGGLSGSLREWLLPVLARLGHPGRKVRGFGEMVNLLWEEGREQEALRLEMEWEKILPEVGVRLMCGYPLHEFRGAHRLRPFEAVCSAHSRILPSEGVSDPAVPEEDRQRAIALLQQKAATLEVQTAELEKQVADLLTLHEVTRRLTVSTGLEETLREVLGSALAAFGTTRGIISLANPEGDAFRVGTSLGFSAEFLEKAALVPAGKGPCSACLRLGRTVVVEDTETDHLFEGLRDIPLLGGFRAVHSLPLINRQGRILGVLSVQFDRPHRPSRRELAFGEVYARLAADSLEQAELRSRAARELEQRELAERKLREQARTQEIVARTAMRLVAEHDMGRILGIVAEGGREIAGAPLGAFLPSGRVPRGSGPTPLPRFQTGAWEGGDADPRAALVARLAEDAFGRTEPVRVDDIAAALRERSAPGEGSSAPGIGSFLAVPVVSRENGILGAFCLAHPEAFAIPERVEEPLAGLAAQAAVALENARLHLALQEELEQRRRNETEAQRFAALVRTSSDAIISKDLNSRVTSWNKAAEAIFGYKAEEMIGRSITLLIPADLQSEEDLIIGRIRRGETLKHYETVRRRKDGRLIDISLTVSPIRDAAGNIVGASKIARDITERKRVEAALGESERRFRMLADSAPVFIWMADTAGALTYMNRYRLAFSGRPLEREAGEGWFDLIHPEDRERCREAYGKGIASRAAFQLEYRARRQDGSWRWILDSATPRFSDHATFLGFIGCGLDLTDHKSTEEQLRQSQKMDALGRLAGGIAHDFNNLLTSIAGFTDLALGEAGRGTPLEEYLQEVRRSADRAASLTQQLLAYSRKQVVTLAPLDLNAVVSDLERMLRRLIGEDVLVRTALHPELGKVKADQGQIQQILVNLCLNARDAMPKGGTLTIETANVYLAEDMAGVHLEARPGPHVMLAVTDTGVGMSPEVQSRLFEPFFTTKPVGKGTGLGLSSVYGIVKHAGGSIAVQSAPGNGTTFKIFLPLVEAGPSQAASAPWAGRTAAPEAAAKATLLLAEDEDAVRRFLAASLRRHGFQVVEAADGLKALEAGRRMPRIDLLVSDIVMPGLNGRKLAEELRAHHPSLKVLFISGYTQDFLSEENLKGPETAFLQKPFKQEDLLSRVRAMAAATVAP